MPPAPFGWYKNWWLVVMKGVFISPDILVIYVSPRTWIQWNTIIVHLGPKLKASSFDFL